MPVVDVFFTTTDLVQAPESVVVIIDVLRATSTILTALQNGAKAVIPVASVSEAQKTAANLSNPLLAGERNAVKPAHFDLGNSPLEFVPESIFNKEIVLTTTNGTRAVKSLESFAMVAAGAFLNARAVGNYLNEKQNDVLLYCAGSDGKFSLEDALCAAQILSYLENFNLSDAARWTLQGAKSYSLPVEQDSEVVLAAISQSQHALRLKKLGFEQDITYCAQLNKFDFVPLLKQGKFRK